MNNKPVLYLILLHLSWRPHGTSLPISQLMVCWVSPSVKLKPSWREQSYLLCLLPSPYPLDRKTIVGTLNQGHKLWSKILYRLLKLLPCLLLSKLAPVVDWLGGPPRNRTCSRASWPQAATEVLREENGMESERRKREGIMILFHCLMNLGLILI